MTIPTVFNLNKVLTVPGATGATGPAGTSAFTLGLRSALPAPGVRGRVYQCTDYPVSYTDTGSAWQAFYGSTPIVEPVAAADSNWSWVNQGTSSVAQNGGGLYFTVPATASTGLHYFLRPVAGNNGSNVSVGGFLENGLISSNNARDPLLGVAMADTVANQAAIALIVLNTNSGTLQYYFYQGIYTGATLQSNSSNTVNYHFAPGGPIYLRMRIASARIFIEYNHQSPTNGAIWTPLYDNTLSTWFTTKPNKAGIIVQSNPDISSASHVFHNEVVSV